LAIERLVGICFSCSAMELTSVQGRRQKRDVEENAEDVGGLIDTKSRRRSASHGDVCVCVPKCRIASFGLACVAVGICLGVLLSRYVLAPHGLGGIIDSYGCAEVHNNLMNELPSWKGGGAAMGSSLFVKAEAQFVKDREGDHDNSGGDRMSPSKHDYAPTYSKFLSDLLPQLHGPPVIVEIGVLTGTGLAMWQKLFPDSYIFGFDLITSSFENNLPFLAERGFETSKVKVSQLDQLRDNTALLQATFGSGLHPNIVVDDGYHDPTAMLRTFRSIRPFLKGPFVYFVEDLRMKQDIYSGRYIAPWRAMLEVCDRCSFRYTCNPHYPSGCIFVIVGNA